MATTKQTSIYPINVQFDGNLMLICCKDNCGVLKMAP